MRGAMDLGIADDGERAVREQAAQVAITPFADIAEPVLAATLRPRPRSRFAEDQSWHTCPGRRAAKRSGEMPAAFRASASASDGASIDSSVSWNVP